MPDPIPRFIPGPQNLQIKHWATLLKVFLLTDLCSVVTVPKFQYSVQYQWKSTVLGTNFGTKAKHKNMLIKKHIFINKVKQK